MDPTTEWFASMYRQAHPTLVQAASALRANGGSLTTSVLVVADTTDPETQAFVRELGWADGGDGNGWIAIVPQDDVVRALRLAEASHHATVAASPLAGGKMRVLFAARARVQCTDLDAV